MSRLIWFQLVDTQGHKYKEASPYAVFLSAQESVLIQFLDAVKGKFADSHLNGISPANLRVYENKDAFLANQESYLKPSTILDDRFGKKEETALWVVVQSFTQEQDTVKYARVSTFQAPEASSNWKIK